MRKTGKRLLAIALGLTVALGTLFAGCGGNSADDSSMYHLSVVNYNGGVGSEWIEKAIKRYEDAHKNDVFPNDKVGIKVELTKTKEHYSSTINLKPYDIVIDQDVNYVDLASTGALLDITDVVADTTNGASIESRMTDSQKSALKYKDKYYVIPHYEYFAGIAYDINVFEDKKLYLAKNTNNGNQGFINSLTDEKSVGPDGVAGTYDDGLPATYDQFYKVMDRMVSSGVTPFVWSGQYKYYANGILFGLLASYCGYDELITCISFNSGDKDVRVVDSFSGNTPVVSNKKVTLDTGYVTSQLAGKYYALEFLSKIMSNSGYYQSKATTTALSNTAAQKLFVDGLPRGEEPIGFLIDSNYWYNEAKTAGHFKNLSKNGYTEETRKFGWMPLPGVVSDSAENKVTKSTIMNQADCFMMINSTIKDDETKVKVAKDFITFLNTEESLQEFTLTTGGTKALKYSLTAEQKNSLNGFAKSVWNMKENSDVVYMMDGNAVFTNNQSSFQAINGGSFWNTEVNGSKTNLVIDKIYNGASAKDCFLGMKVDSTAWNTSYGKYFNN